MNFATKLVVSFFTIAFAIVGGIWTGFETLDGRMNDKVQEGKKEVLTIVYQLKGERDALLKAQDDKVATQYQALTTEMSEMRKDIRTLIRRGAKLEKSKDTYYTRTTSNNGRDNL